MPDARGSDCVLRASTGLQSKTPCRTDPDVLNCAERCPFVCVRFRRRSRVVPSSQLPSPAPAVTPLCRKTTSGMMTTSQRCEKTRSRSVQRPSWHGCSPHPRSALLACRWAASSHLASSLPPQRQSALLAVCHSKPPSKLPSRPLGKHHSSRQLRSQLAPCQRRCAGSWLQFSSTEREAAIGCS